MLFEQTTMFEEPKHEPQSERTKEQYLKDVRAWAAEKGLDETQTSVIVRVATFVGQKKIAAEFGVSVYQVKKIVQSIREKVGWSDRADTMRIGLILAMTLSNKPKSQAEAEFLYGELMKREGETA
ncbi:hypothetical protein [Tumebacillus permanentifrigoris]|uniref:Uncharacterized protein n=1 Tax=Tumebacillus permanentifrigoris TaxID=378543 RepID=A0A316D7Z7_9BACL|nr:hypothetical protein [Tumebacillus permanentifrigoris]PWK10181.1 hypothetical protein C7459_1122 [Tumebacillus permanentifrigoris]